MKIEIEVPESFTAHVRGVPFPVAPSALPEASLAKVFTYGLQRILNDSAASAKSGDEATGLATKRWDNLLSGTLRATPVRAGGDPVTKRAMELALAAVHAHPKFLAWRGDRKASDKAVVAEARRQAEVAIAKPDNKYVAQAKVDVAAAKALSVEDLEIDI